MMRTLLQAVSRERHRIETPNPDRMCAAYGILMRRLFTVLPHEHTRLEVQHMLYTAQVLSIARSGRPLFANQFTATMKGPVILTLWRLQSSQQGLERIMHPVHLDLLDEDDRDAIESVADALARQDSRKIAIYANSHLSASARSFVAWTAANRKTLKKGPDGFLGDASITLRELEDEVRRRYAGRNALENPESADRQPDASAPATSAMAA